MRPMRAAPFVKRYAYPDWGLSKSRCRSVAATECRDGSGVHTSL